MKAVFVELPAFARHRSHYLDDLAFARLQLALMRDPCTGDLIENGRLAKGPLWRCTSRQRQARWSEGDLLLVGARAAVLAAYPLRQRRNGRPLSSLASSHERSREAGVVCKECKMKRKTKRNLFAELNEGFDALAAQRENKLTLREHPAEYRPAPEITADELISVRERLKLSRAVFASYLRTNVRTLENWEQGRAKPNAQAALLIKMVEEFPDTVQRLSVL